MKASLSLVILLALLAFPRLASAAAPAVTPEQVKSALPALEQYADQVLKGTGVPGCVVAVVFRDEVIYLKGFGVREIGKPDPVDGNTVFPLASVSKPIATTVVAALVGEGKIGWDDRVIDHDPGFRLLDPWVTRNLALRDLLCHRSGLPDHAGDLLEDMGYDRAEVLRRLRYLPAAYPFRAGYEYTNFGFSEAGFAAARTAGTNWEDLCAEKLYRPLGMTSTSSRHANFVAAKNRVRLHVRVDGKYVAKYDREPDAQSPAGGVSSSGSDLAKWVRLQLAAGKFAGKPIIPGAALNETHRPQVIRQPPKNPATDRAGFYALGWNVSYDDQARVHLNHSGAFDLGASTCVTLLPGEQLGILALTNAAPIGVPEAICLSFVDLVLAGKIERDWLKIIGNAFKEMEGKPKDYSKPPAQPTPPLPASAYTGVYTNDFCGPIEVIAREGTLHLVLGPKKLTVPLRHWDRDVYFYQPIGEMAGGPSAVTFQVGPERRALSVLIDALNPYGQGTLQRQSAK